MENAERRIVSSVCLLREDSQTERQIDRQDGVKDKLIDERIPLKDSSLYKLSRFL